MVDEVGGATVEVRSATSQNVVVDKLLEGEFL